MTARLRTPLLLLNALVLSACATGTSPRVAAVSRPPLEILARARAELVRRGFTITDAPMDTTVEPGREPIGGVVRARRAAGRDLDTGGLLYEVIEVSARPENGQTRLEVVAGMESVRSPGLRQRVPSTRRVRSMATELLQFLTRDE